MGVSFLSAHTVSRELQAGSLAALDLVGPGLITVSRDDVEQGKPAPDPYLRAAALLGVAPQDCLVVEDSAPGAAAGLAAGMLTLGWPEPHRHDIVFPAGAQVLAATPAGHELAERLARLV